MHVPTRPAAGCQKKKKKKPPKKRGEVIETAKTQLRLPLPPDGKGKARTDFQ